MDQITVHRNFKLWNDALQSRVARNMTDLYAPEFTLLPTILGRFIHDKAGADAYFELFLSQEPHAEIVEEEHQDITPDCYIHAGTYKFTFDPAAKREPLEARFSFVWRRKNGGAWLIMHHHSSQKPINR